MRAVYAKATGYVQAGGSARPRKQVAGRTIATAKGSGQTGGKSKSAQQTDWPTIEDVSVFTYRYE